MNDPSAFLYSLGQTLAVMALYPEGHPSRERTIDGAYEALDGLIGAKGRLPSFTFLDGEVMYGRDPLRDLKDWDWGNRLAGVGIERLEVERKVNRDEFEGFLQEIYARVTQSVVATGENRQMRSLGIRFGPVGLTGQPQETRGAAAPALLNAMLGEEVETLEWLQAETQSHGAIPLIEAEAVVRSLSVAMHGHQHMVLPLLYLKEFDQYTTTHSLNVSVLSMALAENVGCGKKEVRGFGVAGLLHDIGKIRIPVDVLTKPGKLNDDEWVMIRRHPVEGARMIMKSDDGLDLAAVVAYEHHLMLDGGGYPKRHYAHTTTFASQLVHICDVFDALRTKRPYRDAWEIEKVYAYLLDRAGVEFDSILVARFIEMMRRTKMQLGAVADDLPAPAESAKTTA
jgi:putative nucleotidyltransferase with HDIG domain